MVRPKVKSPFKTTGDARTLTAFYAAYDEDAIRRHMSVRERIQRLKGLPRRIGLYMTGENTFQTRHRIDPHV